MRLSIGKTEVLCTASTEDRQPPFLRNTSKGWITAEYRMLPRSTHQRRTRETDGRGQEIQRLVGRSLRQVMTLDDLRGYTVTLDCDIINADGGTRCASITAGCVALILAVRKLDIPEPKHRLVSAISAGITNGNPILDMDYATDSKAEVDANFVLREDNLWVEIQSTAEGKGFSSEAMHQLMTISEQGCKELHQLQRKAIGEG